MPEKQISNEERLAELIQSGEAIGELASNEAVFEEVIEAYRSQDAKQFQAALDTAGLFHRCRLICRWLCIKYCGILCLQLAGPEKPQDQLDINEIRAFAKVAERLSKNEAQLKELITIIDREDVKAYQTLVKRLKLEPFRHQLCRWICAFRCRTVCEMLCPPPPLLTKVAYIPTSQIDALGYAAGPSIPPGTTSADNKPGGSGDHPFGGLANIRGVFNIAAPHEYRVESGPSASGPWTPIVRTVPDYKFNPAWPAPGESLFLNYNRVPTFDGWYTVSEMGLAGADYLTDWQTPAGANDLYYLRLSVRTAALTEFFSPVTPARVDNVAPTKPSISLQLQAPDGSRKALGCCEEVKRGDGNLVVITLQASDANFSKISVNLLGGCGASYSIVDTGGTTLSKSYNGDITDTGYPAPKEFLWDPWAEEIDPCCYLVHVRIWDRAIVNNAWGGGHSNVNWHSLTIA
jgi:hypothetical protein